MFVKILKRAGIGFLLGMVIGNLIPLLGGTWDENGFIPASALLIERVGSITLAVIIQNVASGVFGALCFAGMTFYDIEKWPLALATVSHCGVILITFLPIALLLGWVYSLTEILIMVGIQITVYFLIWLIIYMNYRKQVRELNEINSKNQNKKSKTDSDQPG